MATSALARITGTVLKVDRLQGTSKNTGNPYDFTQCKVIVGDSDVTEVTLPDNHNVIGGTPGKGEEVDWLAEVRLASNGRGLNVNVQGNFPVSSSDFASL